MENIKVKRNNLVQKLKAERNAKKQTAFDLRKSKSKKAPKDASHYNPTETSVGDVIKLRITTSLKQECVRRLHQSANDKRNANIAKTLFKAEHPQKTIVSTIPASKHTIIRKMRRMLAKLTKSAPKSILRTRTMSNVA